MADISPAQRIVAAFNERYELCGPFDDDRVEQCLAAAFRAAVEYCELDDAQGVGIVLSSDILAIAAELETINTP